MCPPDADRLAAELLEQQGFLRRVARELAGEQDADDAAQDAWVALLSQRRARPRSLRAWLRSLLRYHHVDRRKRDRRRAEQERLAAREERLPGVDEIQARLELVRRVAAAVCALPEPFRRTVYLRMYMDRGLADIARELDVPLETVHSRLRRGRELLRERLGRQLGGRDAWALALVSMTDAAWKPTLATPPAGGLTLGTGALTMSTKLATLAVAVLAAAVVSIWQPWRPDDAGASVLTAQGTETTSSSMTSAVPGGRAATLVPEDSRQVVAATAPAVPPAGFFVCGSEGEPIEGARIRVLGSPPLDGVTAANGRWRIPPEHERAGWCEVTSEGRAGVRAWYEPGEETRVELFATTSGRGRVLDADTRDPVPGARVGSFVSGRSLTHPSATCDASGRFELLGVPELEKVNLSAWADLYLGGSSTWDLRDIPEGAEVELLVRRAVTLEVRLIAAETGAPLSDLDVHYAETDAGGRACVQVVPDAKSGRLELEIEGTDFYALACSFETDVSKELELALPAPGRFEGVVLDGAGRPVPDARIEVVLAPGTAPPRLDLPHGYAIAERADELPISCELDETGRYLSPALFPGEAEYMLVVRHPLYPELSRNVGRLDAGGIERRDLVLASAAPTPVGTVHGRVTLNGEPAEPAEADVWLRASGLHRPLPIGRRASRRRVLDPGEFSWDEVPVGRVELSVHLEDFRPDRLGRGLDGARVEVDIAEGEVTEHDFDLVLPMATIAGRVLGAGGAPLPELRLGVSDAEGGFTTVTDVEADGSFRCRVPDDGREFVVSLHEAGTIRTVRGVRAGDLQLEIGLSTPRPTARLPVRVVDDETERALQEWDLAWCVAGTGAYRRGREPSRGARRNRPGAIHTIDLAAGELELFVSSPEAGYRSRTLRGVRVRAGENPLLELRLERGLELELVLADDVEPPDASRVRLLLLEDELFSTVHHGREFVPGEAGVRFDSDALVFGYGPFYSASSLGSRFVRFGEDRRATVRGLAPGSWRFKGAPSSVVVEPEFARLPAAGPVRIRWAHERN